MKTKKKSGKILRKSGKSQGIWRDKKSGNPDDPFNPIDGPNNELKLLVEIGLNFVTYQRFFSQLTVVAISLALEFISLDWGCSGK